MFANHGPEMSLLRPYSLGVVAENKLLSSNEILVTPIEQLTMLDGEIKSNPTKLETAGTDASGNAYQTSTLIDQTVKAEWLPLSDGNRLSAPDVRRGAKVHLYRYGDTDRFYWVCEGTDLKIRKLETVVWGISATTDEATDSNTKDSMYWIEMSSHSKTITLHTSKKNGEFCTYACQFNLVQGRFLLTDDLGNEFDFNSKETRLAFKNAEGTELELNKQNIFGKAPNNIHLQASKSITLKAGSEVVFDAPVTKCKGRFECDGQSHFKAAMRATGITSNVTIQGPRDSI